MIISNLPNCSDKCILASGTITITGTGDAVKQAFQINKGVIFKDCVPFTVCISNINNTQTDNAKDIYLVMPVYNLIECSDNYLKIIRKFMVILERLGR